MSMIENATTVTVEFEDGIAWVSLNRPNKRNSMNPTLCQEMNSILEELEVDDRCRVLVLTGAGDSFSAGMDLGEFFRATDGLPAEKIDQVYRLALTWFGERLRFHSKPTIAMANGWCFGGGFVPLISCDLAISADEAKYGVSEVNWGIIPAGNVLKSLNAVMGERNVMHYSLTAELFDGKRAAEMGLVNRSVPRDELRDAVKELAKILMSKNAMAVRATKHAVRRCKEMTWEDSADYLNAKLDQLRFHDTTEGREHGMKQFLDDKTYRPGIQSYRQ